VSHWTNLAPARREMKNPEQAVLIFRSDGKDPFLGSVLTV